MKEEEEIVELFEKYNDEYLKFDKIPVEERFSNSPDLCAFNLLYNHLNEEHKFKDIIQGAEHDEIFLMSLDDLLLDDMTEKDILYLTRCGIRYNEEFGSLSMFV